MNVSREIFIEEIGFYFFGFIGQYGYDRILKVFGWYMRDFLNGLDNFYEYLWFIYLKLKVLLFFCENEIEIGFMLYY